MKHQHGFLVSAALIILCCVNHAMAQPHVAAPTPQPMRIHIINVGQAEAILLEFPKAVVMIDAGGENTNDAQLRDHLGNYLTAFFQRRTDLQAADHRGIIDTVIVSHPHMDHTMRLFDVVRAFHVKNLIDGGNASGSGIAPLMQARQFVTSHQGRYLAVRDSDIGKPGFSIPAFTALHAADNNVGLRLLSGSRGCENANNDSLVLLVGYKDRRFIFTGDAEAEADDKCDDEISTLLERYSGTDLLRADVYKADHHGSANGTTDDWLQAIRPTISVISAGQHDPQHRGPEKFHAWQFGHPRAVAIKIMEEDTSGARQPKDVNAMRAVRRENPTEHMTKAVYCTCWDGDIVIDGTTLQVRTSQ
jgi:beta-lactamase superfamily II metal-dependent hydrolase